jgi:hypothetical protein
MSAILPDKNAGPTFLSLKASKGSCCAGVELFFFFLCASKLWKGASKNKLNMLNNIDLMLFDFRAFKLHF